MSLTITQTGDTLNIVASSGEALKGFANVYRKTQSSLKCLLADPPPECARMRTTYDRGVVLGQPPAGWSCKFIPFNAKSVSDDPPPFKAATFNVVATGGSGTCNLTGTSWRLETSTDNPAAPAALSLTCAVEVLGQNGKFKDGGMTVAVRPGRESAYGWIAEITAQGKTELDKDVAMAGSLPGDAVWKHAQEVAQKVAPNLNWSAAKSIREINIAFSASLAGNRGINIYEVRDAQPKPLVRLVIIEETILGRCR